VIVYKYGYGGAEASPDISPFVVKLETWLRLSGIAYETRTGLAAGMPKGKLPAALIDGRMMADSSLIIEHLQAHHASALRDEHLNAKQRAQALALKSLFETHLYFIALYMRWCVDRNFTQYYRPKLIDYAKRCSSAWQRPLVPVLAPLLLPLVRRQLVQQARQQGIGRHSYEEVVAIGIAGWAAAAELIGDEPYLFGDRPSTLDATVFAFVHAELVHPVQSAVHDFVRSQAGLVAYHERIWQRHWQGACAAAAEH